MVHLFFVRQVLRLASTQIICSILVAIFAYGCADQPDVKKPPNTGNYQPTSTTQSPLAAETPDAVKSDDFDGEDIDVGGYTDKEETAAAVKNPSNEKDTASGTDIAGPPAPPAPPPKGLVDSERHDGQITFQSRLQPFTLVLTSFVNGKTVATKQFVLGDRDRASRTVPLLCVTGAKTCLVISLEGGITQTAGKSACAKGEIKGPTKIFVNSDVDGKGIGGSCFDDPTDVEDAFTVTCPLATEMVLGTCSGK